MRFDVSYHIASFCKNGNFEVATKIQRFDENENLGINFKITANYYK